MARRLFGQLYIQVLIGIAIGALIGVVFPDIAVSLQPLADAFIKLIKMLLAPIIFGTVVLGIAKMGNVKEVGRIGVRALTSKGSAGVAGGRFVTLAATLSTFPDIPAAGLVLLLGVDRFMNEARAVTSLIGNGVATIAIAKWEGALDAETVRTVIAEQKGEVPRSITLHPAGPTETHS